VPTLLDFRRWLCGESVPGLPSWPAHKKNVVLASYVEPESEHGNTSDGPPPHRARRGVDPSKFRGGTSSASARYTIGMDGRDAVLHFGKYNGSTVRAIKAFAGGEGYLRWILIQEFPDDLKQIVSLVLEGK